MSEPVKFIHSEPKMKSARYRCMNPKCKAEDSGKFFENEPVALVINCWQCGGGRGLSIEDMMQKRKGMAQILESEADASSVTH